MRPFVAAPAQPSVLNGVRVTGVARTVVDLARTGSLESAVAAADHALRHGLCSAADLRAEADAVPARVRGRPVAALVAELADGDSMSVGESLSRVQMFRLGLPRPRLQVEHVDGLGSIGFVDFDWDGVVGEFDGKVKYRVPPDADPQEAAEILWREKKREDRLRVGSGSRGGRGTSPSTATASDRRSRATASAPCRGPRGSTSATSGVREATTTAAPTSKRPPGVTRRGAAARQRPSLTRHPRVAGRARVVAPDVCACSGCALLQHRPCGARARAGSRDPTGGPNGDAWSPT